MNLQTMQSPLRRWDVLTLLAREINAAHFVEVGVSTGRTTSHLLRECPDLRVTAVDSWAPHPDYAGRIGCETYETWDFEKVAEEFWRKVGDNRDRVTMHRMESLEAAPLVESADLVFIDAAHDKENALADIEAWWPKVREGGIFAFHDYQHKFPGVMRAVSDCFPLMAVGVMPDSVGFVRK